MFHTHARHSRESKRKKDIANVTQCNITKMFRTLLYLSADLQKIFRSRLLLDLTLCDLAHLSVPGGNVPVSLSINQCPCPDYSPCER